MDMDIRSVILACAILLAISPCTPPGYAHAASNSGATADSVQRLLVKRRAVATARGSVTTPGGVRAWSAAAGVALTSVRPMSGGAEVVMLPHPMTPAEAQAIVQRLQQDPGVEFVEPDRRVRPFLIPNDPDYSSQWYLHDARGEIAAANLPGAWDLSDGAPGVVVAVIDTGLLPHADIDPARVLPGYDFVSDPFMANDGDGRDTDTADPGDWVSDAEVGTHYGCGTYAHASSWHGTHVAGIIGASADNGIGVSGVNPNAKLLPVRVLGKCGGYLSDVLDGARWAAGVADPSLPPNPHPARVLNLSLGAETVCTPLVQSAINDVLARGAVVVAAAGNNAGEAAAITPGNCAGVIAVAALDRGGNRAYYSSSGPTVALSAPGGAQYFLNDANGLLSLFNVGTSAPTASPAGDTYAFLQGTSVSAPQVAAVASLMLALNPWLSPAQIREKLQATARTFPAGSTCTSDSCGAGMLDAAVALQSAANTVAPIADAGTDQTVNANTLVALNGVSSAAATPARIVSYSWTQLSGPAVALSHPTGIDPTFVAPVQGGTLRFQLTVADDGGLTATDAVDVQVAAATVSSSSADSNAGGGDSRCFIATAAYGTAEAADVRGLRRFRDRYLMTNPLGRAFVATYYRLSPPFADAIRPHPWLRQLVRIGLTPYVAVARWFNADRASLR
jgi:serine protease